MIENKQEDCELVPCSGMCGLQICIKHEKHIKCNFFPEGSAPQAFFCSMLCQTITLLEMVKIMESVEESWYPVISQLQDRLAQSYNDYQQKQKELN